MHRGRGITPYGSGFEGLAWTGFGLVCGRGVAVLVEAEAVIGAPDGPLAAASTDGTACGGVAVRALDVCVGDAGPVEGAAGAFAADADDEGYCCGDGEDAEGGDGVGEGLAAEGVGGVGWG
jgi:hypothetical protein